MRTTICHGCDQLLTEAANAMRHHASVMHAAIQSSEGSLTEAQRKDFADSLVASFNDAQSASEAYHQHLFEHGLLPARAVNNTSVA